MDKDEVEDIPDAKIKKLKNLKMFKNMTDEEVREYLRNRETAKLPDPPQNLFNGSDTAGGATAPKDIEYDEAQYQKKYKEYMKKYHKEYGVDMNDANDAQALQALVRLVIQSEFADVNIMKLQRSESFDSRTLKNIGDYQRSVQTSITELQDRLGISRKIRKERQVDDIPQYIRELQTKARDLWNRTTTSVRCQKCQIELARYWLNFPDKIGVVHFEAECEKCHENVVYELV